MSPTLCEVVQLGDPIEHGGLAVAPLFPRRAPGSSYCTLDEALGLGLTITEVDDAGSVPELLVRNPTGARVLLYDGEELLGAKQNRILNVTVLVEANSELRIPVSCVEQGRWSSRSATFAAASHAAGPEVRRAKGESLSARPLELGAAQTAVWARVAQKSRRHGHSSPTGAHSDLLASRAGSIEELRTAFPYEPGQCGAVLGLAGRAVCLDLVSRPDAFATLYPKLLTGYLLDGLEALDGPGGASKVLASFVEAVGAAPVREGRSVGLGEDLRLNAPGVLGSGLRVEDELIQLSAYAERGDEPASSRAARVARPSRRIR